MSDFLIGRKIGMSRSLREVEGDIPLTVIEAGSCFVVGKRTQERDGYEAVQLGFGEKKRVTKPLEGFFKKVGVKNLSHVFEFRSKGGEQAFMSVTPGQKVGVDIFKEGDRVNVTGWSKGRGFQGVVKRHGYSGGPQTHGSMTGRRPGSIGCSATPGRVIKGKGLPGRMGGKRITVRNLQVLKVYPERNLLLVKGAVPGAVRGILLIKKKQ